MRNAIIVAVAICASAGVAEAQVRGGQPGGRGFGGFQSPIALLLENRSELNLTDEQLARLEVIEVALDEENAEHMAALESLRSSAGTGDSSARDRMRTTMQTVRANQDAAVESAMEVLDEGQRTRAQELIAAARPQRRPGGGRPPQP